nr:helix-turn-helix domain-containing protein [uncultured Dethiosulfovibrio sp.]
MNGEKLRSALSRANMTQGELAELMGVSSNTVWRWAAGKVEPSDKTKKKMASLLDCSTAYFMDETDDPTPSATVRDRDQILRTLREGTGMSLSEASAFLGIEGEELQRIEEGAILLGAKDKKRIMRAYANYLADDGEEEEGQQLIPIQGGGPCGLGEGELSEVLNVLAQNNLIRKSVRMMEDMTEEEQYKVFQYIQDQELVARVRGKKEA